MADETLLVLDAPRAVSFADRSGRAFTFHLKRISADRWVRFFEAICIASRREGQAQVNRVDADTAAMDLVLDQVERVEGYSDDFVADPKWKDSLPPGHIKLAAKLLQEVTVGEAPAGSFDPRHIDVVLDAKWGSQKPGTMTQYRGLVHRFRAVTAAQWREYNRVSSETRVYGGARAGTTVYVSQQKVLMGFYDELIESVEGYGVGSGAIVTADEAKQHMDAFHKAAAVAQLFAEPDGADSAADSEAKAA